ncbi:hypothetical protein HDU99_002129 [Rhizoclosmatium hyalinum]|nr:hypothetical protein HDU99_002129 [Rhizoclosmatium hyalinum]
MKAVYTLWGISSEKVRSFQAAVMFAGIRLLAQKKLQPVATYILTSSTTQVKSIDNHPVFKGAVEAGIPVVTRAFLEDRLRLGQTASRQRVAEICVSVRWVFSSGDYLDIGMSKLNTIHNYTVITGFSHADVRSLEEAVEPARIDNGVLQPKTTHILILRRGPDQGLYGKVQTAERQLGAIVMRVCVVGGRVVVVQMGDVDLL